jgi:dTDP-4-dehydrorhamnose reductase
VKSYNEELEYNENNKVEIWGGAECSFVRVGNSVYDQLGRSGHMTRIDDLDLFAGLNIKTIRYPLLWEMYAGDQAGSIRLNDARLDHLRELGIKPIAGLLHHGSGPFSTDLSDPNFPRMLAEFAFMIAERYPWIDLYTPVNEPLTTARFSGLYGIWYPHQRSDRFFLRMLVNELRGTILSMKAVKSVNPEAGLVQTEDLCRIFSTPVLRYQADFENERRWLTYDILTGKVTRQHPLWKYITDNGIGEEELEFFNLNAIIPGICGFNYYVTSERFLDERRHIYPSGNQGGNGFQRYADVEAVRVNKPLQISAAGLLEEAWNRYGLPLALTEVHLACTREEQLRWFNEAMVSGRDLRQKGIDFRAVTAWSFFGSYDWSSLLCEKRNEYEPGIFDARQEEPRPTALAQMIKTMNSGDQNPYKDLLATPGWWRRGDRFVYREMGEPLNLHDPRKPEHNIRPLLIIGARGSLGSAFAKICDLRGINYVLSDRSMLDIASEESVNRILGQINPWGIINAAGFTRIDEAEKAAYTCFRENTIGPVILAEACRSMNIKLVTFSSDQVFNGRKKHPYTEEDTTGPLNLYGLSKSIAEAKILKINPSSLIIRSGSFFNPWHDNDSLGRILRSGMTSSRQYHLASDIIISPAYIPDLVHLVLDLMIDDESGIRHISNQEEVSYYEFVKMTLNMAGLDDYIISAAPSSGLKYSAARPQYSVLKSSSGIVLPAFNNAVSRYLDEFRKEPALTMNHSSL